eukprot:5597727-Pleurochrysis_carterae.AAC.2
MTLAAASGTDSTSIAPSSQAGFGPHTRERPHTSLHQRPKRRRPLASVHVHDRTSQADWLGRWQGCWAGHRTGCGSLRHIFRNFIHFFS